MEPTDEGTVVAFAEEERQAVLLALAKLSLERPGWDYFLNSIAIKMDNVKNDRAEMFESFRQTSRAEPKWGVWDYHKQEWVLDEVTWEGSYGEAQSKARIRNEKRGVLDFEPRRRS